jgi:hypothetical protein
VTLAGLAVTVLLGAILLIAIAAVLLAILFTAPTEKTAPAIVRVPIPHLLATVLVSMPIVLVAAEPGR